MIFQRFKSVATIALSTALLVAPLPALAADMEPGLAVMTTESSFEDAVSDLENAIVNEGLVIDYKGMVGDMLARTGEAVGAVSPYSDAVYIQFCSARHTHAAVAADPQNIAACPYVVFAYEMADGSGVHVGYNRPEGAAGDTSAAAIAEIDALLEGIVTKAASGL